MAGQPGLGVLLPVGAAVLAATLAVGCASVRGGGSADAAATEDSPDVVRMVLPVGDPELGREAFRSLGCGGCHEVRGAPELSEGERVGSGPDLVRGAPDHSAGDWATAIVAPSHESSWPVSNPSGAEMPATYDRMTVGQLMDLVAFLERPGD